MRAVGDHLACHAGIGEKNPHGTDIAMKERRHGIEDVRRDSRPRIDRRPCDITVGGSVTDRGNGSGAHDRVNRLDGARELRGDGDHPDAPLTGVEDAAHLRRLRRT